MKGEYIMSKEDMDVDGADSSEEKKVSMEFPSNSKKPHEVREEKKVGKIIKGKLVTPKKTLSKKFAETFLGEDIKNVGSYIIYDVLIPAAKDTLEDLVVGILRGGNSRGSRYGRDRDRGRTYVSYDRCSSRDRDRDRDRNKEDRKASSERNHAHHNFDDIIFDRESDASDVLDHLVDLTIDFEVASVADLYGFVDREANFTDDKWGWEELSSAGVRRTREGWILDLPKPKLLD